VIEALMSLEELAVTVVIGLGSVAGLVTLEAK
jgi:hypothetical protein